MKKAQKKVLPGQWNPRGALVYRTDKTTATKYKMLSAPAGHIHICKGDKRDVWEVWWKLYHKGIGWDEGKRHFTTDQFKFAFRLHRDIALDDKLNEEDYAAAMFEHFGIHNLFTRTGRRLFVGCQSFCIKLTDARILAIEKFMKSQV